MKVYISINSSQQFQTITSSKIVKRKTIRDLHSLVQHRVLHPKRCLYRGHVCSIPNPIRWKYVIKLLPGEKKKKTRKFPESREVLRTKAALQEKTTHCLADGRQKNMNSVAARGVGKAGGVCLRAMRSNVGSKALIRTGQLNKVVEGYLLYYYDGIIDDRSLPRPIVRRVVVIT